MRRDLITIMTSTTHVLDYAISGDAVERYVNPRPGTYHEGHPDRLAELAEQGHRRRRELVRELRDLARALEAGESPFTSYGAVDPDAARAGAEAEIEAMDAHIRKLTARAKGDAPPPDPLADLVVEYAPMAGGHGQVLGMEPRPGVRIRHVPTGLEAVSVDERSQHANRASAARDLVTAMASRQPDDVRVGDAVISQLMEWAGHAERKPPTVLDNLDMSAPPVPLTAEQHEQLMRDTAERNERWARSRRRRRR